MPSCPLCGATMDGLHLAQGLYRDGTRWQEERRYCMPCDDRRYPHRGNAAAHRLRLGRAELNLGRADAARALGLPPARLSDIELGAVAPPDEGDIEQWLSILITHAQTAPALSRA